MQTVRSIIELFRIQHEDHPPAPGHLATVLLGKTTSSDVAVTGADGTLGPYLTAMPANPLNNQSGVGTEPGPNVGWVYTNDGSKWELKAVSKDGTDVLNF